MLQQPCWKDANVWYSAICWAWHAFLHSVPWHRGFAGTMLRSLHYCYHWRMLGHGVNKLGLAAIESDVWCKIALNTWHFAAFGPFNFMFSSVKFEMMLLRCQWNTEMLNQEFVQNAEFLERRYLHLLLDANGTCTCCLCCWLWLLTAFGFNVKRNAKKGELANNLVWRRKSAVIERLKPVLWHIMEQFAQNLDRWRHAACWDAWPRTYNMVLHCICVLGGAQTHIYNDGSTLESCDCLLYWRGAFKGPNELWWRKYIS